MKLLLLAGAVLVPAVGCGGSAEGTPRPNVFIVLVDTLRADHLGCYGYELPTSPEIDDLAEQATLFEANTSQCNSTGPSIISILTGVYPRTHSNYFAVPLESTYEERAQLQNLAERLTSAGYGSAAIWSHPMWRVRGQIDALERGWGEYSVLPQELSYLERIERGDARHVTDRALAELDRWDAAGSDAPLLMLAHYFDPHAPYVPPAEDEDRFLARHLAEFGLEEYAVELTGVAHASKPEFPSLPKPDQARIRLALGRARYDEEIRDMSRQVGRLLDGLRERELFDDSLIVFLADHGENMEEVETGHDQGNFTHWGLYEGVIGTPLIVKLPGQDRGARVTQLSQNIDLLPTLLELLGIQPVPPIEGRSLVSLLQGSTEEVHERVYSESSDRLAKAVKTSELKLIQDRPEASGDVFRWKEDREERNPALSLLETPEVEELRSGLREFRPIHKLILELEPAEASYSAEIELELASGFFLDVASLPGWSRSMDRRTVWWRRLVGSEPISAELTISRALMGCRVRIRSKGEAEMARRVWIGETPLVESSVFPLPEPLRGAETTERPIALTTLGDARGIALKCVFDRERSLELELTQSVLRVQQRPSRLDVLGLAPFVPVPKGARKHLADISRTEKVTRASGRFTRAPKAGELRWRIAVDGSWPLASELSIDGLPVDGSVVGFVWDEPLDMCVRAELERMPTSAAPPGSIRIWNRVEGAAVIADLEAVDEQSMAELSALGYAE